MTSQSSDPELDGERLALALDAARLGEIYVDMVAQTILVSERMAAITGMPVGLTPASEAADLFSLVPEADRDRVDAEVRAQLAATGRYDLEHRLARFDTGEIIWVRAAGLLVRSAEGVNLAVCGVLRDISDEKRADDQRHVLMAELDHRVKNVLATVQTLAQQSARRTTSIQAFLSNFAGRLKAMASANELLTAARWRGASVANLAAAELGGVAPSQTRFVGPDLFLTPRAANAVSLALHELTTNALKYGALSVEAGRVEVSWDRLPDNGFELDWVESGGPPVAPPQKPGFGTTLLNQVTGRELNGSVRVEYRAGGVRVRLTAGPDNLTEAPADAPAPPRPRVLEAPAPQDGPIDLKGARVLIVEDAVLLALELETGLADAGAQVLGPAYSLEEALALLDQDIDAAVLDASLNGLSVTPVAEALEARGVPFLFATGYGEAGGAPTGFDAPIIRKPYDVTQVGHAVAALLNGPRTRAA